jgi:olfactory receptor
MYLLTLLGNLLMILAVSSDSHLHIPMYFFLSNLSLADVSSISTTVPKMIVDILTQNGVISYVGCLTQMSFYLIFVCMEDMLPKVMAYDQYMAICHHLHYSVIMNPHLCVFLVLTSLSVSILEALMHNLIAIQITKLKDVEISNFYCDPTQILSLSCSNTFSNNMFMYFVGIIYGLLPLSGVLFSYYKIISSILRIPSLGGMYKAFSICGSHLSVVGLFYGTYLGVYVGSVGPHSHRNNSVASVMYTVVIPMLNPFIYSLRNKDIKSVISQLYSRVI